MSHKKIVGAGFVANRLEPTVDFDYESVESNNQKYPHDPVPDLAYAFKGVLCVVWRTPKGRLRTMRSAMLYFTTLTSLLDPELLGDLSYSQIGNKFRVSKQAISKIGYEMTDLLRLHFRRQKRDRTRAIFSRAQRGHVNYVLPQNRTTSTTSTTGIEKT